MGGSSGSQMASRIELPEWVSKAGEENYNMAKEIAAKPYQTYSGPRIANFTTDQTNAMQGVRQAQGAYNGDLSRAMNLSAGVGEANAPLLQNTPQMAAARSNAANMNATTATGSTMDPSSLERVSGGTFKNTDISPYLNQYRQAALDPALAEIQRQGQIMQNQNALRASSEGAWGGSRHGIMDAELQRNLLEQLAKTEAQGLGQGFDVTSSLAQADLARQQQAALANQQYGNQALFKNMDTANQFAMSNAQMAQQAAMQNAQFQQQTGQFNAGNEQQANQYNAGLLQQAALANQQAQLSKMGLNLQSAGQQSQMAQQRQQMGYQDLAQLMGIGQQQQQMNQQNMDLAYNDFLREQNYPQEQMNFLTSQLSQQPYNRTTYQPGPNLASQMAGGGLAASGILSNLSKAGMLAK